MTSRSRTPVDELGRGRSPPRRPRGGHSVGDCVVVDRVVEKVASTGPVSYPLLMKTNYNDWALLMKIKLEARLLWVVRASLPAVTAPPSLTDGARLSAPSFPKSSPASRPRVLADKIPVVESATRRVLAPPQCPPVHLLS
jgi:hypothetical protein